MTEVRAIAPAKVNLHLRILARRTDGYHDLQTLFQAVDLHDLLHVRRGGPVSSSSWREATRGRWKRTWSWGPRRHFWPPQVSAGKDCACGWRSGFQ